MVVQPSWAKDEEQEKSAPRAARSSARRRLRIKKGYRLAECRLTDCAPLKSVTKRLAGGGW